MNDEQLTALLNDYTAPVADEGFTVALMDKLNARSLRISKIRARAINAAFFIGGAFAAVQLPLLFELFARASVSVQDMTERATTLPVNHTGFLSVISASPDYAWIMGLGITALLAWAILDGDSLQL